MPALENIFKRSDTLTAIMSKTNYYLSLIINIKVVLKYDSVTFVRTLYSATS